MDTSDAPASAAKNELSGAPVAATAGTPDAARVPSNAGGVAPEATKVTPNDSAAAGPAVVKPQDSTCQNTINANIVALDQPFMLNRIGASMPQGMIFALMQDVVPINQSKGKVAGNVMLRSDKRPRPIVLRVNEKDCLQVTFTNLLASPPSPINQLQPVTRQASVHVNGMQLISGTTQSGTTSGIAADGSNVGENGSSLVDPGKTATYKFYAGAQGTYLLFSTGATFGTNGSTAGQLTAGLFGAVNVEPQKAEYYRSQVTAADLQLACQRKNPNDPNSPCLITKDGHNLVNYDAVYPASSPYACRPILKMVDIPRAPTPGLGLCQPVAGGQPQTFYTDLTAIITGPNHGLFTDYFPPVNASPNRNQPFREFTIHYHEMLDATQAFTDFYTPLGGPAVDLSGMLVPGKDNFGINYGTGGIGAEVLANRFQVGPMAQCVDCKFEEFFLSAWAVGDPAMVVDVPANVPPPYTPEQPNQASQMVKNMETYEVYQESGSTTTKPPKIGSPNPTNAPLIKATKAFYPDDPSNVYHSYLDDHVIFRILHAGANLTHVHHQHAHQWLYSPNDDNSTYLDSQLISPGSAFTLEIDYNGSGNRNKTIGDSIFHCHFYPHFAAGMWSLWRVHDVFENGSQLSDGIPVSGTRALPDGEIQAGTPIPAIVPIPTLAMAPLPSPVFIEKGQVVYGTPQAPDRTGAKVAVNPGFPFFIPGIAGHRAPAPPLDFACETDAAGKCLKDNSGNIIYMTGGLARHVITGGSTVDPVTGQNTERHNQWDFTKNNPLLSVKELKEEGEPVEQVAMAFHAQRKHPGFTPDGQPATFIANGLPPQPGAPYADPAPYDDADGGPANPKIRRYKAADIQMNVTFNKKGWHYPQQRFISLWSDVASTLNGKRAPEPFFFRANSHDIIEYWLTNLVPSYYELDDFQVRTPTDIIGQHIHLVKFDVTSSDGAANGFNYEDGTLSAEEVRDRINAIRLNNKCAATAPVSFKCPKAIAPPPNRFGPDPSGNNWAGAQTTIQRWYADPLENQQGQDRTLRTVFTHDHFGPSTHQQIGLYAGLVVEPKDSTWFVNNLENNQNVQMYTRDDGGPTSWQARILTDKSADSYREFVLEFQDLSLAYQKGSPQQPAPYPQPAPMVITPTTKPWGWADNANAINPASTPQKLATTPTLISGQVTNGTMSVNYRNEPLPLRVNDPSGTTHDPSNPQTDMSYAFSSIKRLDDDLNCQPDVPLVQAKPCGPFTPTPAPQFPPFVYPGGFPGASPYDPYTPLMRAYQNDKVQVRVLVGAYLFNHNFSMYGLKWLFEPGPNDSGWMMGTVANNSGYRDNQAMGISEHFEMLFTMPLTGAVPIDSNRVPNTGPFSADYLYMPGSGVNDLNHGLWGILRSFNTEGKLGNLLPDLPALPNNPAGGVALSGGKWSCPADSVKRPAFNVAAMNAIKGQPLQLTYNSRSNTTNPNALVYVLTDSKGTLPATPPKEPLILRANAGDCITVNLFNAFNTNLANSVFATPDPNFTGVDGVSMYPSARIGLRPQLLSYDVTQSNGANIGFNPVQTVAPNGPFKTYQWYAGNISYDAQGKATGTPIEFGSTNLMTSDSMEQMPLSLIGALIIEPQNSTWTPVGGSNVTMDVKDVSNKIMFREFVAITQENIYLTNGVFNSVNFGTEPMTPGRFAGPTKWNGWDSLQIGCAFSSIAKPSPGCGLQAMTGNPQTPIFAAVAGTPVRFRMLHPDGLGGFPDDVWTIHGHIWQLEPYVSFAKPNNIVVPSATLGLNRFSQWVGSRDGFGPGNHFDILIDSAGGVNRVFGDYLYKSFPSSEASAGVWGIFRVCNPSLNPAFCVAPPRATAVGTRRVGARAAIIAESEAAIKASPAETAPDPGERFNLRKQLRRLRKQAERRSHRRQQ
jgi:hypothetical protein